MSLLFETIKCQNGILCNIDLHSERLNKARKEIFKCTNTVNLLESLSIPKKLDDGIYKCRVVYAQNIEQVEFFPYVIKPVKRLKIVESDTVEYKYKYVDRRFLDELMANVDADDIIIVKHGCVTDSSYANIVFFDGKKFVTPSTPLLHGTKRELLIRQKIISEQLITRHDLNSFKKAFLINAMLDLDSSPGIDIHHIY